MGASSSRFEFDGNIGPADATEMNNADAKGIGHPHLEVVLMVFPPGHCPIKENFSGLQSFQLSNALVAFFGHALA